MLSFFLVWFLALSIHSFPFSLCDRCIFFNLCALFELLFSFYTCFIIGCIGVDVCSFILISNFSLRFVYFPFFFAFFLVSSSFFPSLSVLCLRLFSTELHCFSPFSHGGSTLTMNLCFVHGNSRAIVAKGAFSFLSCV